MDQRHSREDALNQVARLRAEIDEVRGRLSSEVIELKKRVPLSPQKLVERSVELIAGQAGTIAGSSLSLMRHLFRSKSA